MSGDFSPIEFDWQLRAPETRVVHLSPSRENVQHGAFLKTPSARGSTGSP